METNNTDFKQIRDSAELVECPVCNRKPLLVISIDNHVRSFRYTCCRIETEYSKDPKDAEETWNKTIKDYKGENDGISCI